MRRLAGKIPQHADVTANFDFSGAIDNHFYRTLAAIGITPAYYGRTSREGLGTSHGRHSYNPEKNTLIHVYHPCAYLARSHPFNQTD
ncbi:MAG: hypothetical protein M3N41_10395 [Acidobacteriota bacterium]|nr:hypothetical protein [Acidobacteriota bacterium]